MQQRSVLVVFGLVVAYLGVGVVRGLLYPDLGQYDTAPEGGPFGPPVECPLMAPYEGEWDFEFEATMDAWRADGVSEEDIDHTRQWGASDDPLFQLHPDMIIADDVAILPQGEGLTGEYRFFKIHEHDGFICAKAWHHEDRFDYGDMSKCFIRLELDGDRLALKLRDQEGWPDNLDPDFEAMELGEGGSLEACVADDPPGDKWRDWRTYIFARKSADEAPSE